MDAKDVAEAFFNDVLATEDDLNYEGIQQWEKYQRGEIECYLRAVHLVEGQDSEMTAFCAQVEPHVQALLDDNPAYQEYHKERYGA